MRTIAFVGGESGAGKTAVAVNVAVLASHLGMQVLLIDASKSHSAADWWKNRSELIEPSRTLKFTKCCANNLQGVLSNKHTEFELVVVDGSSWSRVTTAHVARVCDIGIIMVDVRSSNPVDNDHVLRTAEIFRKAGKPLAALTNFCPPSRKVGGGGTYGIGRILDALEQHGLVVCPEAICDRVPVSQALEAGASVREHKLNSHSDDELTRVWYWLEAELKKTGNAHAAQHSLNQPGATPGSHGITSTSDLGDNPPTPSVDPAAASPMPADEKEAAMADIVRGLNKLFDIAARQAIRDLAD
jgi:hypothetical protein